MNTFLGGSIRKSLLRQFLNDAHALICKGWCKGTSSKDYFGEPCLVQSEKARFFCLEGALLAAAGPHYRVVRDYLVQFLPPSFDFLSDFNDVQIGKQPILELIEKGLESLE